MPGSASADAGHEKGTDRIVRQDHRTARTRWALALEQCRIAG
jgi:hypothetical protein